MGSVPISDLFARAVADHQAGRLSAAELLYRQVLKAAPRHTDAWHSLGIIALQSRNSAAAVECLGRAVELQPDAAEFHSHLGLAYRACGCCDEAIACQRRAVELRPGFAETHYRLGVVLKAQGADFVGAVNCYRRALELKPDYAEAYISLGNVLLELGQVAQAVEAARQAVRLKPKLAAAHNSLGIALKAQGCHDEAVGCYRQAVTLKPEFGEAHNNLGNALQALGQFDAAVECYQTALRLNPDYVTARHNLGTACEALGRLDDAVALFQQALRQQPTYAEAHNSLGNVLRQRGHVQESLACLRRALQLRPDFCEAHNNLGNALKMQGVLDEAVACYERALELKPDFVAAHMNLLTALPYRAGVGLAELAAAHAEFDRRHAEPFRSAWRPHHLSLDPDRRLRLGFVSADFARHPVGMFLIRVLEHLDPQQSEIVCYSDRLAEDELTARFRMASHTWRNIFGQSDEQLAEQIRADEIDVLFDLAGHLAGNRLLVFARKPAPIQITWLGYAGTTGLSAMDYLIADNHEIPSDAERHYHYREQILRMPDGYVCYDPPADAPAISSLPALQRGFVTFGCFNNPAKLTTTIIAVWAKILHRVPDSRLVLKYRGMNDPAVSGRITELFSREGIASPRLEFLDWSCHAELLAEYGRVDLALDSLPYSGGVTTCEALWMGVPVVTCPGETFASRHSLSHLSTVGFTETVARDLNEYVKIAVSWAGDWSRLTERRARLRSDVAASPLCDGPRFAAHFLSSLLEIWQRYSIAGAIFV